MRDETLNDRLRELGLFDALVRALETTRPVVLCSCTTRMDPAFGITSTVATPHDRGCTLLRVMEQFLPAGALCPEDRPESVAVFAAWVMEVLATRKQRTWVEAEFALAITQNRKPDFS